MDDISARLSCFELWGGNLSADHSVELPGLAGWVYSAPIDSASGGGDVHYFSVCSKGMVSRIAVADVAGHGSRVSSMAENLRKIFQHHTDNWDQSALMRELNEALVRESLEGRYATAAVLGFYLETGELLFSSAGHPPVLWYHAQEKSWEVLQECTRYAVEIAGLPLGLIPGTAYCQTGVRLDRDDMLVLYTDGITEARDSSGNELGQSGLLELARSVTAESPSEMCRALMTGIQAYRGSLARCDDETLVVLRHLR
jgi:sigma-B regulation protein RsbU (phosphoserine phosphatase)